MTSLLRVFLRKGVRLFSVGCASPQFSPLKLVFFVLGVREQGGAVEAYWAHNPEVSGSKPLSAKVFHYVSTFTHCVQREIVRSQWRNGNALEGESSKEWRFESFLRHSNFFCNSTILFWWGAGTEYCDKKRSPPRRFRSVDLWNYSPTL